MVQAIAENIPAQYAPFKSHLARLLHNANEILHHISINSGQSASSAQLEALTWKKWIRNRSALEQLSKKMHDVRIGFTEALTLLNAYVFDGYEC